jgi:type I restriction enzyme R subunit
VSPRGFNEDDLIEQPCIELFGTLGWETVNAYDETFVPGGGHPLGREGKRDVVLVSRLRPALERLNPELPPQALDLVIDELTRDRSALSPVNANREVYDLLKNGVRVKVIVNDEEQALLARVIDWTAPENNNFLLVSQFWVTGDVYTRRADLVGFVNGIPLVFIELKASHKRLEDAYKNNLRDYRNTVPQLFWYNALVILSNGRESRLGTITSLWEHFAEWKKIDDEGEEGIVSLDTIIRGTCEKRRLLDIGENFTLFSAIPGGIAKVLAKNHQYLGVNNAVERLQEIREHNGQLGVFWHTQGSGKSFSMMFFAQKVLRKLPGNFTFLILTDRKELDEQIYGNFASAGIVTEPEHEIRADSGEGLKQLLREDHRYIFTLIQKFHTEQGATYPVLSERSDIIVIADEAHRSQYDTYALNMRNALPNAAFIAFTGTPLVVGEEKTREVFGDYVSVYDFRQSIQDGATVPLYYENRIPELQLTNADLNEDMEDLLDKAELDDDQTKKLDREFGREYHLITREDRLDAIARDIIEHFVSRGFRGKGMVVSIDKAMAVSMYDRVSRYWRERITTLEHQLRNATDPYERGELQGTIAFMRETDMAVVVSQAQNEVEDLDERGLDIRPHRKRMLNENMADKFKDPDDAFRLVFVCAMWMTGFDVPSCSTIYLDKPMRNHTLMQTIARANRVFPDKNNGLIVDYVGVFRNLQKALAVYGSGGAGVLGEGETPVKDKDALVNDLALAIADTRAFLTEHDVDANAILRAEGFERVKLVNDAVDAVLVNDESKNRYLALAGLVNRLYRSVQPDPAINEHRAMRTLFWVIANQIRSLIPQADITPVMRDIGDLLDRSIDTRGYVIADVRGEWDASRVVDLSNIDFDALRAAFEKGHKRVQAEKLKGQLGAKLKQMVEQNKQRIDYAEKFQELIDEYNAGSANIEQFFQQLMEFAHQLTEEEQRHIAENLTEEELAIFDLLTKPDPTLTKKEEQEVKKVAQDLLASLKREKLVLDWRKRQQSRAGVWVTIEEQLDQRLPATYTPELFAKKCNVIYQHVYDSYYGGGSSVYEAAN